MLMFLKIPNRFLEGVRVGARVGIERHALCMRRAASTSCTKHLHL